MTDQEWENLIQEACDRSYASACDLILTKVVEELDGLAAGVNPGDDPDIAVAALRQWCETLKLQLMMEFS